MLFSSLNTTRYFSRGSSFEKSVEFFPKLDLKKKKALERLQTCIIFKISQISLRPRSIRSATSYRPQPASRCALFEGIRPALSRTRIGLRILSRRLRRRSKGMREPDQTRKEISWWTRRKTLGNRPGIDFWETIEVLMKIITKKSSYVFQFVEQFWIFRSSSKNRPVNVIVNVNVQDQKSSHRYPTFHPPGMILWSSVDPKTR